MYAGETAQSPAPKSITGNNRIKSFRDPIMRLNKYHD